MPLSTKRVVSLKKKGRYSDSGGLYLQVTASGTKSWLFRYKVEKRERNMGLGEFPAISLAEARLKASECRRLRANGLDPKAARDEAAELARRARSQRLTFMECADKYIQANRAAWKNKKHADQWNNTLHTYCEPLGDLPVASIDTRDVLRVLQPIWEKIPETANRLRGRIEAVLDWAMVHGYREEGLNPARWKGNLAKALPRTSDVRRVRHHPALPFQQISDFVKELRSQPGIAARAVEFLILTAMRTKEVRLARWDQIDFDARSWTIPAEQMKRPRPHSVPLSQPAMALLHDLREHRVSDYVFPGAKERTPVADLSSVLRRMNRKDITIHGFRSTFRDWASEIGGYHGEVVEAAMAHAIRSKVEKAYRRGDLFDARKPLMESWANHCARSNVVSLRRRA